MNDVLFKFFELQPPIPNITPTTETLQKIDHYKKLLNDNYQEVFKRLIHEDTIIDLKELIEASVYLETHLDKDDPETPKLREIYIVTRLLASRRKDCPPSYKYDKDFVDICLATSEYTPKEVLVELSHNNFFAVQVNLAKNKNTPMEVLEDMFFNTQDYFLKLNILYRSPIQLWQKVLQTQNYKEIVTRLEPKRHLPEEIQKLLIDFHDVDIRRKIAELEVSKEVGEILINDPDLSVRYTYASHTSHLEHLIRLSQDNDEYVKKAVLLNPNCPGDAFDLIVTDKTFDMFVKTLIKCPNLPRKFLPRLLEKLSFVYDFETLLYHVKTLTEDDIRLIYQFATKLKKFPVEVRVAFVKHPLTPPDILLNFKNDQSLSVKKILASNPKTPPEILAKLVRQNHYHIKQIAIKNPNTPLAALLLELTRSEGKGWIVEMIREELTKRAL